MTKISSGRRLLTLVGEYITQIRNTDSKKPLFPNIAGFVKFAGITPEAFALFKGKFPEEYAISLAAFEDAALNSGATATLISMYLRHYGMWEQKSEDEFICDHDIGEDGR